MTSGISKRPHSNAMHALYPLFANMSSSIEFTAGPLLVFVCIGLILFGTFTAQLYYYYMTYENDSKGMKTFVWFLAVLELFHTVFCIMFLYTYLITHFGDAPNGVERVTWTVRATVFIEITIVIMTQALYIARIWQLSKKSIFVTSLPTLCLLGRLGFGIASFVFLCLYDTWQEFGTHPALEISLNSVFALELATDAIISAELIYYLSANRTRFAKTRDIVHKLMAWIINTGVITIVFSAAILVTFNVTKGSLLFMGLIEMISKLYANTMLAMLNARKTMRKRAADFNTVDLSESRARETHIQIYTETEITSDPNHQPRIASHINVAGRKVVLEDRKPEGDGKVSDYVV